MGGYYVALVLLTTDDIAYSTVVKYRRLKIHYTVYFELLYAVFILYYARFDWAESILKSL